MYLNNALPLQTRNKMVFPLKSWESLGSMGGVKTLGVTDNKGRHKGTHEQQIDGEYLLLYTIN